MQIVYYIFQSCNTNYINLSKRLCFIFNSVLADMYWQFINALWWTNYVMDALFLPQTFWHCCTAIFVTLAKIWCRTHCTCSLNFLVCFFKVKWSWFSFFFYFQENSLLFHLQQHLSASAEGEYYTYKIKCTLKPRFTNISKLADSHSLWFCC